MGEKLTKQDVEKIKEELRHRKDEVMPAAIRDVQEARAQGDLSENFEYKAAKQFLNRNKSRIRYLEKLLLNSTIIEDKSSADVIGLNDEVELLFEATGMVRKIKLVTPIRGNALEGKITINSPVGKAIMGHKAGDRVHIRANEDLEYDVVIQSFQPQGESDDEIRSF